MNKAYIILIILFFIAVFALQIHILGENEKEIVVIAKSHGLTPRGPVETHMTTIGTPFFYANKGMSITSLPVEDKKNKRIGTLFIRHYLSDTTIAVFDGVEVEYN